jgi:hypothetical protein
VPPADRPALLGELLGLELDYRLRQGEHAESEDYRRRFPGCSLGASSPGTAHDVRSDIHAGASVKTGARRARD